MAVMNMTRASIFTLNIFYSFQWKFCTLCTNFGNSQGQLRQGRVTYLKRKPYYSLRPKLSTKSCFTKQKCQIQMGMMKPKNVATPLSTLGINTTHQHFQMRYITLFQLKELKSYQLSKFECVDFLSKQTLHLYIG